MRRLVLRLMGASLAAMLGVQALGALWANLGPEPPPPPMRHAESRPPRPPPPPPGWLIAQTLLSVGAFAAVAAWVGRPLWSDLEVLARTSRRVAEGDLSARTGLTEGPVGEIGALVDTMSAQVEGTLSEQMRMLAAISHELRTPHARLRFQLEALGADATDAQQPWLSAIDAELESIDVLLGELIDLQRLQEPPLEPADPAGSGPLVAEAVARMRLLAKVPIDVSIQGELPIGGRDLRRIVENLLSNAIRHARSQIRVELAPGALTVEDDGPGVPDGQSTAIFRPFASLDPSRSRELGGVGLGLALVRRAAERWGAHVGVDRGPLGGARFRVRWPEAGEG